MFAVAAKSVIDPFKGKLPNAAQKTQANFCSMENGYHQRQSKVYSN